MFRKIGICLKAHTAAVINTMMLMEWREKYPVLRCVKVCKVYQNHAWNMIVSSPNQIAVRVESKILVKSA